jgi:hypothetical protein
MSAMADVAPLADQFVTGLQFLVAVSTDNIPAALVNGIPLSEDIMGDARVLLSRADYTSLRDEVIAIGVRAIAAGLFHPPEPGHYPGENDYPAHFATGR